MNSKAFKQGMSFGIISSTMTVLGVSIGMWTSGGDISSLISSILGLAISNAFADAFSIYMANVATANSNIALSSALITGMVEFILPFFFAIPLIFFKLKTAIIINIIMGLILVGIMGYYISILNKLNKFMTFKQIGIYLTTLIFILSLTSLTGKLSKRITPDIKNINNKFTVK